MFSKLKEKLAEEREAAQNEEATLPPYTPQPSATTHQFPPSTFETRFASLSLHTDDRIRLLRFPTPVIDRCRASIQSTWPQGIKEERDYAGSHEFKLKGHPWHGWGEDANLARRLIKALLAALHQEGWLLTLNSDVSKTTWDKDTMLFRHQVPTPEECDWCCVAFSKNDRVRFLDAPPEVYQKLPEKFGKPFLKTHSVFAEGIYEFKFDHNLWWTSGTNTMKAREVLLILLETLESEGWIVYASINQKNGGENYTETDTWHCCKPKGWTYGQPVFHK